MEDLPSYIGLVFGLTTLISVLLFYKAASYSKTTVVVLFFWLVVQSLMSISGFYTVTNTFPSRFILLLTPALIFIIFLFFTNNGNKYLDQLDIKTLSILHVIRVPVEIVLYWLFIYGTVPQLMTFEGRNFDILAGLSAPFIYYYSFVKRKLSSKVMVVWNLICLLLLVNIFTNAVLSLPVSFQMFAFDQPNIAVMYFPFVWLPTCVVPLVLLSHLASIRILLKK